MKNMLVLRVSATGSRSWLIEAPNAAGKKVQRAFGTYPALGLAEARLRIASLAADIAAEGIDPEATKRAAAVTLRSALEDWRRTQHPKDTTYETYTNVLQCWVADWWDRPLRAIKREEILARCEAAWGKGSLRQGDQIFQTLRALYNHAGIVPNPAANIKPRSDKTKVEPARPMAPEVLPVLLDSIEELTTEARMYYKVLMFTGFRGLGAKAMEWQYLHLGKNPGYSIPSRASGFKDGGAWRFPLPEYLGEELARYKRWHDRTKCGVKYVFPGEAANADSHRQRSEGSLRTLRKVSGLPGLRDNDFRDTWATYLLAMFQKNFITERLLDHRFGGTNVGAADVGMLYATAIPASIDMSAQLQLAAVDEGEALRPLVDAYAAAVLHLGNRGPRESTWTPKERTFYEGIKRTFLQRNPSMSVERWLHLAAVHPQIAFAPQEFIDQLGAAEALNLLKKSAA
jgi:integrase